MKMKQLLTAAAVCTIGFMSCEDQMLVPINADYTLEFPLDIKDSLYEATAEVKDSAAAVVATLKADSALFFFTETRELDLMSNEDVRKNQEKIKGLSIASISCTLYDMPENSTITSLKVKELKTGFEASITDLKNGTTIELPVNDIMIEALASYLYDLKKIDVIVEGFSDFAPVKPKVKLLFKTKLKTAL
jgi:hypothetical protein